MTQATNLLKVVVIGGEGIGPEVTDQSVRVLNWFIDRRHAPLQLHDAPYGAEAYREFGQILPAQTMEAVRNADAILFGATGGPDLDVLPKPVRHQGSLLRIREGLTLFANLRPIIAHAALFASAPLKAEVLEGVDFVIVRELVGAIYFGQPRGIETLPDGQRRGVNTQVYTTSEIRRVVRVAFELARTRKHRLCSVDKANVMESGVLWREEVDKLHQAEFSDVDLSHMYVDNCAMQIVRKPNQSDVIVTDNLFGDILSDCAAMAAGSLGMLPSAAIVPRDAAGRSKALYEPVHGSAPDIAGKNIANPLASIQSVAMMLRMTLGRPEDADLLERAVRHTLEAGHRTADIAGRGDTPISTFAMGDAVLASLDQIAA
ncbi:3-isopropylmalate dehydrogenase [Acidisphaera sp. L21]|uniref:3-isopropylmalate dehydrogenase n=1 Tax=Acidisphaera sp. L21 TaxID=1641851 RepID=UPI00131C9415|nr:3-isopropylmalate dehydrogenase [Acidisphaera sp. L21]